MRALFSSVLAGLLFVSATGVGAQARAFGVGLGDGGVVSGVVGAEPARVAATLSMDTDAKQPLNTTFTVNFRFSGPVTGFEIGDIDVGPHSTVSDVSGSGQKYEVDVKPKSMFEGNLTVTVPANAVNEGNPRTIQTFEVDTRAPELETAEVDEDELILTYDEDLDETSEPRPGDFMIDVDGDDFTVLTVDIRRDEVTLTLDDDVSGGDDVTIDYDPGTNPIQDELGNEASSLTDETVNNTTTTDLPSEPRNLTATADGRTEIDLKWDAPSDIGGSRITGYRIAVSNTGTGNWTDLERDTDNTRTTYTHDELLPGTRQYYRVAAINGDGESPVVGYRPRHDRRRSPGCAQKPHRGRERKFADQPVVERADLGRRQPHHRLQDRGLF